MATFIQLHQVVANALLLLMLLLGLWGLSMSMLNRSVGGSFRSTYVLSIAVFGLQAVVGIVVFILTGGPRDKLHLLYGVVPFLALGAAFGYTSSMSARREAMWLGVAALFTAGLVIRAMTTGASTTA